MTEIINCRTFKTIAICSDRVENIGAKVKLMIIDSTFTFLKVVLHLHIFYSFLGIMNVIPLKRTTQSLYLLKRFSFSSSLFRTNQLPKPASSILKRYSVLTNTVRKLIWRKSLVSTVTNNYFSQTVVLWFWFMFLWKPNTKITKGIASGLIKCKEE